MSDLSTDNRICETCGGELRFSVNSEYAVCDSCGKSFKADADELAQIKRVYRQAELKMHHNSVEAYSEAAKLLRTIPFVTEAGEKIEFCEKRIEELNETQADRDEEKQLEEKKSTGLGLVLFILFLVVIVLALAGAVYIVYHLISGDISPRTTAVIIAVIAVSAVLLIIGKLKS